MEGIQVRDQHEVAVIDDWNKLQLHHRLKTDQTIAGIDGAISIRPKVVNLGLAIVRILLPRLISGAIQQHVICGIVLIQSHHVLRDRLFDPRDFLKAFRTRDVRQRDCELLAILIGAIASEGSDNLAVGVNSVNGNDLSNIQPACGVNANVVGGTASNVVENRRRAGIFSDDISATATVAQPKKAAAIPIALVEWQKGEPIVLNRG